MRFSRLTVSWWPPSPRGCAWSGACSPRSPSQPWPHSSWPSTSQPPMSSSAPEAVPAPHSLGLFGDGAVTVPPVPPGASALALSSNTVVHEFAEPIMLHRQLQLAGVVELWDGDDGGPAIPLGIGVGTQNAASRPTAP